MNHYIIDHKKRNQYIELILLAVLLSFILGYLLGYLYGPPTAKGIFTTITPEPLALAAPSTANLTPAAQLSPRLDEPQDRPLEQTVPEADSVQINLSSEAGEISATETAAPPPTIQTKVEERVKKEPSPSAVVEEESDPPVEQKSAATSWPAKKGENRIETGTEATTKYLIQAGIFINRKNASTFIEQLKKEGFDGLIDEFISTGGSKKYYVRLGPFTDKSRAQIRMAEFKKLHKTSSYILTRK